MDIYPVNNNTIVTAPGNFEFICNTTIDFNLILLIDGMANNTKFDRIIITKMNTAKETVFQYTFTNTISTDNGTTFSCIAINNKGNRFQSHLLTLRVYCEFACVSVCLCVCLPVCACVCVCVYFRECLSVCLSVCLCMCISEYLCATVCLSACQSAPPPPWCVCV